MDTITRRIRFTHDETGESRIVPLEEHLKLTKRIIPDLKTNEAFREGQPVFDDGGKYELLSEEESASL